MKFVFPIDGDVLNRSEGRTEGALLCIKVKIEAPEGSSPTVNGVPCRFEDGFFTAEVPIEKKTALEARCGGETERITVYRFDDAWMKYRLALDDVIISLREIAESRPASIFDHPFFGFFRELNAVYGTKTHFNIYYTDEDGFDLRSFPSDYRKEFDAAHSWMRLTFHARADKPDRIYRFAPYDEMYSDFHLVNNQIVRFAGDRVWRTAANGLHFAETTRPGSRALRDCGSDIQIGYFIFDKIGDPAVAYYFDREQTSHLATRDFWIDRDERIIFSRDKLVLDQHKPDEIPSLLDRMCETCPEGTGTMNFVTHEQYFSKKTKYYLPDQKERVLAAIRWSTEKGYSPCFISDVAGTDMI
ncbi:MAG: hypothetical protein IJV00_00350 [Clostridia bacterium]|nr:hypothetical protein [Clostridia bacterium]